MGRAQGTVLQFRVGPIFGKVRTKMLSLGVVLLILGYIFNIGILITIGWILAVIGLVLFVLGAIGRPLAGRRYWY
jgi:hypothetical protein